MFRSSFVREQIDPRIQTEWSAAHNTGAPFGDLRRTWRREHCSTLNPYGSVSCPYDEQDCGLAFLSAVQSSCAPGITNSAAYFRRVARSTGIVRADNKPLMRDRKAPTDVLPQANRKAKDPARTQSRSGDAVHGAPGDPAGSPDGLGSERLPFGVRPLESDERESLRRTRTRPSSIGSLLGKDNV